MCNNILTIIFAMIAIIYTFTSFGRLIRKQDVPSGNIFLMAVGIAGVAACTLMTW